MIVEAYRDRPPPEIAHALERFETQFTYPLGPGRFFRISHGDDYPRFFRAMGEARCFVIRRNHDVIGVLGCALRQAVRPDGSECAALYLGDLKIDPHARGGRALPRLAEAALRWVDGRAKAAFSVVMDGTPTTPTRYTGRLGIPALRELAHVAVLRVPTRVDAHIKSATIDERTGDAAYRRLCVERYACPGGFPAERSEIPPQWLMTPDGDACGRLEDTRRAKRLITGDGVEMRSAHLSCFAYRDIAAGAALVQVALDAASRYNLPALFVSVPTPDAQPLCNALGTGDIVTAPATIFGIGFEPDALWNINTAEI